MRSPAYEQRTLDHALPTGHIDRLLFGFPRNPHAGIVIGAFVSIAMSAQLRGWTQSEFEALVTETKCNRKGRNRNRFFWTYKLWRQLNARTDNARDLLDTAWMQAAVNLADHGEHSLDDLRTTAVETAWGWQDRLLAGVDGLDGVEAMVMEFVANQVEKRQILKVTCPCREVGLYAGVTKDKAHRILKNLTRRKLLILHSRGWYAAPPREPSRRAAIYSLGRLPIET